MNLEELGITKEELQDRVVSMVCDRVMSTTSVDDEGGGRDRDSDFTTQLKEHVKTRIGEAVADAADKYLHPSIIERVENICLEETNKWGEKKGKKFSFTEYLLHRADEYVLEKVNYEGTAKRDMGYGSWTGVQTRICHMVHQHLQYVIEATMKKAMENANSSIAGGIEAAIRISLGEVLAKLKVDVKTQ